MAFRSENKYWVESAYSSVAETIRVSMSADGFMALIGGADGGKNGSPIETVVVSISWDLQAHVVVQDSVLPIWVRGLQTYALPFQPGDPSGQSTQEARFAAQLDDYVVWVSRSYLAVTGQTREQLALMVRRWTETGCDAYQLHDALAHTAKRQGAVASPAILALRVRPRITATVWSGPPLRAEDDRRALNLLLAEPWMRIICGDTTARVAARLLGKPLRVEQQGDNRSQVPPLAYLEDVNLVTEGLITLRFALQWLQGARTARDLPQRADAAARLAHALLSADQIHFIVGRAVNAAQAAEGGLPARLSLIEALAERLRESGRLVDIDYL